MNAKNIMMMMMVMVTIKCKIYTQSANNERAKTIGFSVQL